MFPESMLLFIIISAIKRNMYDCYCKINLWHKLSISTNNNKDLSIKRTRIAADNISCVFNTIRLTSEEAISASLLWQNEFALEDYSASATTLLASQLEGFLASSRPCRRFFASSAAVAALPLPLLRFAASALGFWFGMACLGLNISYRWEKRVGRGRSSSRGCWLLAVAVAVAMMMSLVSVSNTLC